MRPTNVATMLEAVAGNAWAFSLRHFVDATSGDLLCADTWESVGPGRGVDGRTQGGFVDTNCSLIDKLACNDVFPEWAMTRFAGRHRRRPAGPRKAARAAVRHERAAYGVLPDVARPPAPVPAMALQMRRRGPRRTCARAKSRAKPCDSNAPITIAGRRRRGLVLRAAHDHVRPPAAGSHDRSRAARCRRCVRRDRRARPRRAARRLARLNRRRRPPRSAMPTPPARPSASHPRTRASCSCARARERRLGAGGR